MRVRFHTTTDFNEPGKAPTYRDQYQEVLDSYSISDIIKMLRTIWGEKVICFEILREEHS